MGAVRSAEILVKMMIYAPITKVLFSCKSCLKYALDYLNEELTGK